MTRAPVEMFLMIAEPEKAGYRSQTTSRIILWLRRSPHLAAAAGMASVISLEMSGRSQALLFLSSIVGGALGLLAAGMLVICPHPLWTIQKD
jgi:hypothetical protein